MHEDAWRGLVCGKRDFGRRRQLFPHTFFYHIEAHLGLKLCGHRRQSFPNDDIIQNGRAAWCLSPIALSVINKCLRKKAVSKLLSLCSYVVTTTTS